MALTLHPPPVPNRDRGAPRGRRRGSYAVALIVSVVACSADSTVAPRSDAGSDGPVSDADASSIPATYSTFTDTSNWSTFDLATVGGLGGEWFYNGGFDGRNVYFVGRMTSSNVNGLVVRYDAQLPFADVGSWSKFNVQTVAPKALANRGTAFDGRRMYVVPSDNFTGLLAIYDTHADFGTSSAWQVFDTTTVNPDSKGFLGAAFDGRFVYLAPNHGGVNLPPGRVLRYDTTADVNVPVSWSSFDPTTVHPDVGGSSGMVFDGRYLYFVPNYSPATKAPSGRVLRYDTQTGFNTLAAWSTFDMESLDPAAKMFGGGAFDGRYVYFVPKTYPPIVTRYDTTGPFESASSWSTYAATTFGDAAMQPTYTGAIFDGRYLHLVPQANIALRFDTQAPFGDASSWSQFDTQALGAKATRFLGGAFDGEYVYFVPSFNGVVVRFHAKTPGSLPARWNSSFY